MTKQCSKCKIEQDSSAFYIGTRRGKTYLYSRCKICCSIINKEQAENGRAWELKKKYGISLEEYRNQCTIRCNVCDICDTQVRTLHVDHNHTTGKIRGYLCGSCNRGIGLLKDSAQVCYNASQYLKGHDETPSHSRPTDKTR